MGDIQIEQLNLDDEINVRHKKERKELQAKVQALKKSAGKGDKRRKKEVLDEILKLENDLDQRHTNELNALLISTTTTESIKNNDDENENVNALPKIPNVLTTDADGVGHRISKAQKRRDKKAKEEREKQAEILAQEEINKTGPRMMETKRIKMLLKTRSMVLFPIASDGDCLYNAIRHQLTIIGRASIDTQTLRQLTADYILENKDLLIFYMTNPTTGNCLTDEEFQAYCDAIVKTPAWGGQIEIKALSNVLRVPIEILQATGPLTIQGEHDYASPNLLITYHRLMYSLGEHYNSTRPIIAGIDDNGGSSSDDENQENVV